MKSDTLIVVVIFHSSPHIQLWALAGYTFHYIPKLIHLATFFTLHSSLFTLIGIDVLATRVAYGRGDTRFFEFSFIQL